MQLAANILVSWCFVGLAAGGIGIVQLATRQVPLALAAVIGVGTYVCHALHDHGWPIWLAIIVSLLIASIVSALIDIGLQKYNSNNRGGWAALAAALGVYIVVQSALSLIFGHAGRTFILARSSLQFGEARVTSLQVITAAITLVTLAALVILMARTSLGRAIRGLGSNPGLCMIYGIAVQKVRALAVGIGGAITTLAGILLAIDSGLTVSTGFALFLEGLTAAVIGGVGSLAGVAIASLIVALSRHVVAYFGDPQWMDAATFLILIIFLVIRPFGISGKRLRKSEI